MLQNAPFRGLDKREVVNPVDHLNGFIGSFNPPHQGSDRVPFRRPVHPFQTILQHFGEGVDLRHQQLEVLQVTLFCRQCGDLIVEALQMILGSAQSGFELSPRGSPLLQAIRIM